jgi:hypothetical protein
MHTVPLTGNLTNECKWHAWSVYSACSQSQFPALTCICLECTYSRGHTQVFEIRRQNLTTCSLKASYTFTTSLRSTSLLNLSKISCLGVWKCSRFHSRVLETRKEGELEAYLPLTNLLLPLFDSPVFTKTYDRHANCVLSRSCHHCLFSALVGPRLLYILASTHAHGPRVHFRLACERPSPHTTHLLVTRTCLPSYLWSVLHYSNSTRSLRQYYYSKLSSPACKLFTCNFEWHKAHPYLGWSVEQRPGMKHNNPVFSNEARTVMTHAVKIADKYFVLTCAQ